MAIMAVGTFSGVNGIQRKARYPPATAASQPMPRAEPIASAAYAQPFVIIQARPMQSGSQKPGFCVFLHSAITIHYSFERLIFFINLMNTRLIRVDIPCSSVI